MITWPELEIGDVLYSCALDVADDHPDGLGFDKIGHIMNVTYAAVEQVEYRAAKKLRRRLRAWRP